MGGSAVMVVMLAAMAARSFMLSNASKTPQGKKRKEKSSEG
jgi:hypothetical protein